MLRAVLDPGVLVSAAISPRAAPADLLRAWRAGHFELVASPLLLRELSNTLVRQKFRRYLSEGDVELFVEHLRRNAVVMEDPEIPRGATADPDDDYLVGLARAARADALVSGDHHLTDLTDPHPPVLNPRAFLEQLRASSTDA